MMAAETISERLDCSCILKRLIALADFVAFNRREGGRTLLHGGKNACYS